MRHTKWWCRYLLLYNQLCARCLHRGLVYGYRLNPAGYMQERARIAGDKRLSPVDRVWVLSRAKAIVVDYE